MAERVDYYEILGVSANCSAEELKSAYRKKAMQYHPDRNPGDKEAETLFKQCAEAYEVLSDPEKRRIYDQFGHEGLNGHGFQGFSGFEDIFSHFSDIFGEFFGFTSRGQRGLAGADLRYDLEIDFEQAVFGAEVELEVPRMTTCFDCGGTGARPGTDPQPCPDCRGRGQIYRSQGFLRIAAACPTCRGEGKVITDPCPRCYGQGRTRQTARVKVKIPAGVDTGSRLRLRGEGEDGLRGGPPGDLYVVLKVKEDERFVREGDNLIHTVHLDMAAAALGVQIEIPTLGEPKALKIPAGVQSGHVFQLRGEGVPRLRGYGRGDLLVQVIVDTPRKLTARQKELLREFAEIEAEKAGGGGFIDGLKKMASKAAGLSGNGKKSKAKAEKSDQTG